MHERFESATAQLGHESPTIRLAGVYALAAVADDWLNLDAPAQSQVCLDVLCAYQRTPAPDDAVPGEQEVRQTIIRVIAQHFRAEHDTSWSALDLDLTGAVLTHNVVLSHCHFAGHVSFEGASFAGEVTVFDDTIFSGPVTSFSLAKIQGGLASFSGAKFAGQMTFFAETEFSGSETTFASATFSGTATSFVAAIFDRGVVVFDRSTFCGDLATFENWIVAGGSITFAGTRFGVEQAHFSDATFDGGELAFSELVMDKGATIHFLRCRPVDGGGAVTGPWPGQPAALPTAWPIR